MAFEKLGSFFGINDDDEIDEKQVNTNTEQPKSDYSEGKRGGRGGRRS